MKNDIITQGTFTAKDMNGNDVELNYELEPNDMNDSIMLWFYGVNVNQMFAFSSVRKAKAHLNNVLKRFND